MIKKRWLLTIIVVIGLSAMSYAMREIPDQSASTSLSPDEFNDFKNESQNLIENTGQVLTNTDLFQLSKAVAQYTADSDYYVDNGTPGYIVLSSTNARKAPVAYTNGMTIRFKAVNTSTGPTTVNVAGLGVKAVKLADGSSDIGHSDIISGYDTTLIYDNTNFRLVGNKIDSLITYSTLHNRIEISTTTVVKGSVLATGEITNKLNAVPLYVTTFDLDYRDRRIYVSTAVTVSTSPRGVAYDGEYLWVANYISDNVSKINVITSTVVATVSVSSGPYGVAYDGEYMWVTNFDNDNVSKIDVTTNSVVATVNVSSEPIAIAYDGTYMWVANSGSDNVSKLNVVTNSVVATVSVSNEPVAIAYDGEYLWVANYISNNVSKINVITNTVVATVAVGTNPRDIAFDGTYIWVANYNSNNVSKIDVITNTVVATVSLGGGTNPRGIAYDGTYMWVANLLSDNVAKIDVVNNTVVATVTVGTNPIAVAFDGEYMWVTNSVSNNVSKINR